MKETNFTIKLRVNKKGCVNATCSFSSVLEANKNLCLACLLVYLQFVTSENTASTSDYHSAVIWHQKPPFSLFVSYT